MPQDQFLTQISWTETRQSTHWQYTIVTLRINYQPCQTPPGFTNVVIRQTKKTHKHAIISSISCQAKSTLLFSGTFREFSTLFLTAIYAYWMTATLPRRLQAPN